MRKYIKKPSGYFWRIRKKMMERQKEGELLLIDLFKGKARKYAIMIAFADLPIIKRDFR